MAKTRDKPGGRDRVTTDKDAAKRSAVTRVAKVDLTDIDSGEDQSDTESMGFDDPDVETDEVPVPEMFRKLEEQAKADAEATDIDDPETDVESTFDQPTVEMGIPKELRDELRGNRLDENALFEDAEKSGEHSFGKSSLTGEFKIENEEKRKKGTDAGTRAIDVDDFDLVAGIEAARREELAEDGEIGDDFDDDTNPDGFAAAIERERQAGDAPPAQKESRSLLSNPKFLLPVVFLLGLGVIAFVYITAVEQAQADLDEIASTGAQTDANEAADDDGKTATESDTKEGAASGRVTAKTETKTKTKTKTKSQPKGLNIPAGMGLVSLTSEPKMEVYEGQTKLGSTPLRKLKMKTGRHVLTFKNKKHGLSKDVTVKINERQHTKKRVTVKKGKVVFAVKPWAVVYLGNKKLGTTPMSPVSLFEGTYTLRLVNPDKGEKTVKVEVKAGKTAKVVESF